MFFSNIFKKKKRLKLSKELYGEVLLSHIILFNAQNFSEFAEDICVEDSFSNYLLYLIYHLYLTENILAQRYSSSDIQNIITSTIKGLSKNTNVVSPDKTDSFFIFLSELYEEVKVCSELLCINIFTEYGIKSLADCFIEDCGADKGAVNNLHVSVQFSSFIIHHTKSIFDCEVT